MGVAVKKQIKVNFLKWTGKNDREMFDFLENSHDGAIRWSGENFYIDHTKIEGGLIIRTLEGDMIASIGDYIIQGVNGEFYPCKPDIFEKTYDIIKED